MGGLGLRGSRFRVLGCWGLGLRGLRALGFESLGSLGAFRALLFERGSRSGSGAGLA